MQPCPECGEQPPPAEWVVVHGRSMPGNPAWMLCAAAVALLAEAFLVWAIVRTGQSVFIIHIIMLTVAAALLGYRGWMLHRTAADGGDVTWIVTPEYLESRTSLGARTLPWSRLEWALYERGFSPHSVCLTVTQRGEQAAKGGASVWLDSRDIETRALHALLKERIDRAAQPGSASPATQEAGS